MLIQVRKAFEMLERFPRAEEIGIRPPPGPFARPNLHNNGCANPASWSIPDLCYKLPPDKQKPLPFLAARRGTTMSITSRPAIIIIASAAFLTATLALACSSATRRAGDVNTDRAALAALYNATNGSSWQDDTNWLSNGPLGEWHGVSTDADGRVAELDLDGKQLSGPIPSELGNLDNLEFLSLRDNQLSGPIPSELGNLANLEFLSLRDNQLSGSIPSELGNLDNLGLLSLGSNQLSGPIPSELGNLDNLQQLELRDNQFSGCVPVKLFDMTSNDVASLGLPSC